MAINLTGLYSSASSSQSSSPIQEILETWMKAEEEPLTKLEDKRQTLYDRKKVFTDLHSKLSKLKTKAEELKSPLVNRFGAKKAISSDAEKIDVSATGDAELGSHVITVERLAVSDTRVSKQYSNNATSFSSITNDQTFQIEVAHPTGSDPNNRVLIEITIPASIFSQNDAAVLSAISNAINDAMNNAILNSIILRDEKVQASVISEETGISRLVLRSSSSGFDYRMDFTDSVDSLLSQLEVNAGVQVSGTSGGYVTEVGTSSSDSQLNAKFVLDGLTFYRNSNYVSDALRGVTLHLLNNFTNGVTVTISSDVEVVKDEIRQFLDNYNQVLNFIVDNSGFDAEKNKYRAFSDDSRYWNIRNDLRQIMMSVIDGVSNSTFSRLSSIGITGDSTGILIISDSNAFEKALNANPLNVAEIFTTSDTGLVDRLINYINNFLGAEGFISKSKSIIDDKVNYLNNQIENMEDYLEQREKQLREQLIKFQQAIILLGNQQNYFINYSK